VRRQLRDLVAQHHLRGHGLGRQLGQQRVHVVLARHLDREAIIAAAALPRGGDAHRRGDGGAGSARSVTQHCSGGRVQGEADAVTPEQAHRRHGRAGRQASGLAAQKARQPVRVGTPQLHREGDADCIQAHRQGLTAPAGVGDGVQRGVAAQDEPAPPHARTDVARQRHRGNSLELVGGEMSRDGGHRRAERGVRVKRRRQGGIPRFRVGGVHIDDVQVEGQVRCALA
jgi:hypothetical protein